MARLKGKIALVTGAARGIGEAVARSFVAEGATVLVTDINVDGGQRVADALGTRARFMRIDVSREADWLDVTERVVANGGLDVVVNNAGITGFEDSSALLDPENCSLDDWRRVHATNLDGVFLGCKYAIRMMRPKRAGSIINMSSRSGVVGIPAAAPYASSKAAVRNHSKSVALYCAEQGLAIRCNSIHPAAILTPMWEPMLGDGPRREANMQAFTADCPMRRFGTADEVAALALLLASDEAPYINGTELHIDGGILAGATVAPHRR